MASVMCEACGTTAEAITTGAHGAVIADGENCLWTCPEWAKQGGTRESSDFHCPNMQVALHRALNDGAL